jgi:tripartite-type tricarboxylate transporter receptor subunit TctC
VGAAVAGHTQISSTSMPPAVQHVKAGRVRALAVTSARRSPALPDVPTVNEQGFSGFDDLTWTAFFVPAGVPQDVVNRLNSELNRVLSAPDIGERLGSSASTGRATPGRIRRLPARRGAEMACAGQGIGRQGRLAG